MAEVGILPAVNSKGFEEECWYIFQHNLDHV
jgi:hypothetical protein